MKRILAVLATAVLAATAAQAQEWPQRAVTLVVPYAPGGNVDIAARLVSKGLEEKLGQPFVVTNSAGAGGMVGRDSVANAQPDGYTFLVGANGPVLFSPYVYDRPESHWKKDFAPIGSINITPMLVVANNDLEVETLQDLLDLAKRQRILMAGAGAGSSNALLSLLLQEKSGAAWTSVQYGGNAETIAAVLSGEAQFSLMQTTAGLKLAEEGAYKTLAVTSETRLPSLPDVPTLDELGFVDFKAVTFSGLFAPAGIDKAIADKLAAALDEVLEKQEVIDTFAAQGALTYSVSGEEFVTYLQEAEDLWLPILKQSLAK